MVIRGSMVRSGVEEIDWLVGMEKCKVLHRMRGSWIGDLEGSSLKISDA